MKAVQPAANGRYLMCKITSLLHVFRFSVRLQKYTILSWCNNVSDNFEVHVNEPLSKSGESKPEYPEKPPDTQSEYR